MAHGPLVLMILIFFHFHFLNKIDCHTLETYQIVKAYGQKYYLIYEEEIESFFNNKYHDEIFTNFYFESVDPICCRIL